MNNFDYFVYYPAEDILVIYSYEDNTLREDSFYGFEYGTELMKKDSYFWDIDWDELEEIRHKVLMQDYTEEEFEMNFEKNDHFFSLNYEDKYTVQDVLEGIYENEFDQY